MKKAIFNNSSYYRLFEHKSILANPAVLHAADTQDILVPVIGVFLDRCFRYSVWHILEIFGIMPLVETDIHLLSRD